MSKWALDIAHAFTGKDRMLKVYIFRLCSFFPSSSEFRGSAISQVASPRAFSTPSSSHIPIYTRIHKHTHLHLPLLSLGFFFFCVCQSLSLCPLPFFPCSAFSLRVPLVCTRPLLLTHTAKACLSIPALTG